MQPPKAAQPHSTLARVLRVLLILLTTGARAAIACQDSASEEPPPPPSPSTEVIGSPPTIGLQPLPGSPDDGGAGGDLRERVDAFLSGAESATEPARRVLAYLNAANLLLSEGLEPSASLKLLGLSERGTDADRATIEEGERWLAEADRLLEAEQASPPAAGEPGGDEAEQPWRQVASRRAARLRAFADALRAVLLPVETEEGGRGDRRAASGISAFLEDDDRVIASAAQLWQAVLLRRDPGPQRALQVLDSALDPPHSGTLRFDFFARLLRCRILADRGGYAVACALLLQLEERSREWFIHPPDQAAALAAIAVVERQVLRDWHDALGADKLIERGWCRERISRIDESLRARADTGLLRLQAAVPGPPAIPTGGAGLPPSRW